MSVAAVCATRSKTVGIPSFLKPKGSDFSIYSHNELDAIAVSLNTRPRSRPGFEPPLLVYTRHIALLQSLTDTVHSPSIALGV